MSTQRYWGVTIDLPTMQAPHADSTEHEADHASPSTAQDFVVPVKFSAGTKPSNLRATGTANSRDIEVDSANIIATRNCPHKNDGIPDLRKVDVAPETSFQVTGSQDLERQSFRARKPKEEDFFRVHKQRVAIPKALCPKYKVTDVPGFRPTGVPEDRVPREFRGIIPRADVPGFCPTGILEDHVPAGFCPTGILEDHVPAGFCPTGILEDHVPAGFCPTGILEDHVPAGFCPTGILEDHVPAGFCPTGILEDHVPAEFRGFVSRYSDAPSFRPTGIPEDHVSEELRGIVPEDVTYILKAPEHEVYDSFLSHTTQTQPDFQTHPDPEPRSQAVDFGAEVRVRVDVPSPYPSDEDADNEIFEVDIEMIDFDPQHSDLERSNQDPEAEAEDEPGFGANQKPDPVEEERQNDNKDDVTDDNNEDIFVDPGEENIHGGGLEIPDLQLQEPDDSEYNGLVEALDLFGYGVLSFLTRPEAVSLSLFLAKIQCKAPRQGYREYQDILRCLLAERPMDIRTVHAMLERKTGIKHLRYQVCNNGCYCFAEEPEAEACPECGEARWPVTKDSKTFDCIDLLHLLRLQYSHGVT